jgi:uncharacterized protein YecE (DUF72 family)
MFMAGTLHPRRACFDEGGLAAPSPGSGLGIVFPGMRVRTGTSGFSYKEWKGLFYPADLADKKMLAYYSTRLHTVEINNTFYRMPKRELVEGWAAQVGDGFRFVLKAPQRITHRERLEGSEASLAQFLEAASVLGDRLGALLFQLPPFFKKDVDKLSAFLGKVPKHIRSAFEFRHPSWFENDTYAALRAHDVALVGGDADTAEKSPPFVPTASFGYLRLRAEEYTDAGLAEWAARIGGAPWTEAFVFLKHELRGPEFAEKLAKAFPLPAPALT